MVHNISICELPPRYVDRNRVSIDSLMGILNFDLSLVDDTYDS